jgi:hypothetical protein
MNVILLVVIVVIVFFVIQNNNRFKQKEYPLNSSPRGEKGVIVSGFKNIFDTDTPLDKRKKLVNTLRTISDSDKVVLTEVVEKWSLNKNIIDPQTKQKSVEIIKEVMDTLEFFSNNKYHVKDIENVYVMKDKNGNFRTVISAFIYDIKEFHTVKIIIDVVYFENIMYINHIDIDESGVKNVLQHYDIKYKSSGILSNRNNFDTNVEALLDNYYRERYKVVPLKMNDMVDLSGAFSFTDLQKKVLHKEAPQKSPHFCEKDSFDWNSFGIQLPGEENCTANNPSIRTYPPQALNVPVGVNSASVNPFSWMWDPVRGHTVD